MTGRKYFICTFDNCTATFRHKTKYENHLRMHYGERPYICTYDDCNKDYSSLAHLKRHEEIHETVFSCTVPGCSTRLLTKSSLKKHVENVHNKKPKKYKCSVCNEEFSKHSTLQTHSFIHTGVKPFFCKEPNCHKSFLMPCKLKQHMKCHKGYICDELNCRELFPRWTLLMKHKRDCHTKTYKCEICNKEFGFKNNLKQHSLTHSVEREIYQCPVLKCTRFYQAKRHLSDHLNSFHKTRTIPCLKENCHRFFKTENEMNVHFKARHTRKPKKEKLKPPFADIVAGYSKGTMKDLNPQNNSSIAEKPNDESNILNEDLNNNELSSTEIEELVDEAEKNNIEQNSIEIEELIDEAEKNNNEQSLRETEVLMDESEKIRLNNFNPISASLSKIKWCYSDLRIESVM